MGRFVVEGMWTGYRSGQSRVCHRTVHKASEKKFREWAEKTHSITYSDGTSLILSVRDCKPRERVNQINGYNALIKDCYYSKVDSVSALYKLKGATK